MKNKLFFIDNDNEQQGATGLNHAKHTLYSFGLEKDYVHSMEPIFNFDRLSREEVYKVLFDPRHCIVSWSMYTATHAGSLFQLQKFLTAAGRNDVIDIVYIDTSGLIKNTLNFILRDSDMKGVMDMLIAIENNYILTLSKESQELVRLRVSIKGHNNFLSEESVDLNLLTEEYTGKIPRAIMGRG